MHKTAGLGLPFSLLLLKKLGSIKKDLKKQQAVYLKAIKKAEKNLAAIKAYMEI